MAEALKVNKSLQKINLSWNQIGDEGARALAEALKENKNKSLQKINLEFNKIGADVIKKLARVLQNHPSLQKICLGGNCKIAYVLGDRKSGVLTKEKLISPNPETSSIKKIDLSGEYIGDKRAKALPEGLEENPSLAKIGFSGENIGPVGATALAEALKVNSSPR